MKDLQRIITSGKPYKEVDFKSKANIKGAEFDQGSYKKAIHIKDFINSKELNELVRKFESFKEENLSTPEGENKVSPISRLYSELKEASNKLNLSGDVETAMEMIKIFKCIEGKEIVNHK